MIVVGGGAQDASPEVTQLSRDAAGAGAVRLPPRPGVLDSRNPLSVTLPLGRELWGEADVVLAVGTRLFFQHRCGASTTISRSSRSMPIRRSPASIRKPAVALIGDAAPILRRLIDALAGAQPKRTSRTDEMDERQAKWAQAPRRSSRRRSLSSRRSAPNCREDGIFVDEVTQIGFAARLALPVYKPRTFLSPGYQDNLGWGYATALGAQDARRDVPVLSINGDGGFMYTANELATAMRHRIPLIAVVFSDGSFGNVRRIQEENYGNRLIASDLANPDFVQVRARVLARPPSACARRRNCAARSGAALRGATVRP